MARKKSGKKAARTFIANADEIVEFADAATTTTSCT